MGKVKDLHIDCDQFECIVGQPETCYRLRQNWRDTSEDGEEWEHEFDNDNYKPEVHDE